MTHIDGSDYKKILAIMIHFFSDNKIHQEITTNDLHIHQQNNVYFSTGGHACPWTYGVGLSASRLPFYSGMTRSMFYFFDIYDTNLLFRSHDTKDEKLIFETISIYTRRLIRMQGVG